MILKCLWFLAGLLAHVVFVFFPFLRVDGIHPAPVPDRIPPPPRIVEVIAGFQDSIPVCWHHSFCRSHQDCRMTEVIPCWWWELFPCIRPQRNWTARELEKVVSERPDDAGQSAVLHGIHRRITAMSFNKEEVVLSFQVDWVQCEVAVRKQDVITMHF